MRWRAARRLLAFAAAVAATACTEVPSDPNTPVAIELDPLPLPSLVVGDSLRDTSGRVVPLAARALNSRNAPIADAPVRFLIVDTAHRVAVDSVTGLVAALDTGHSPVVASVGSLQSTPDTLRVVQRPDSVQPLDSLRDSLLVAFGRDTVKALRVFVGHDTTPAAPGDPLVPVASYAVRYTIVSPSSVSTTDTTMVLLVNDNRRPSMLDTTDATGTASRALRVSAPAIERLGADSVEVVVRVDVFRPPHDSVPGAPIFYRIKIKPF